MDRLFRRKSAPLLHRLELQPATDILLCSVVLAELWFGAHLSGPANRAANEALIDDVRSRYASLPFDDAAGMVYGRVRAELTAKGQVIGPNDMMIASIALANGITLVSHNTSEFNRVPGLNVEDWQMS